MLKNKACLNKISQDKKGFEAFKEKILSLIDEKKEKKKSLEHKRFLELSIEKYFNHIGA